MSMSVTVLCPGGRRQIVKVTPNTSILHILEEACLKQKLDANMFNLTHYSRVLDVSATVRFANLPNRAQLELAASERSRVDGDVTLATQLTDGRRLVKLVSCNASLWQALEEQQLLPSDGDDLVPVCIYARREVAGESALRATTLRSLGLTGGKAIIRFSTRASGHASGQAHVSAPLSRPAPEPMNVEPASSQDQSEAELSSVDQSQPAVTSQPPVMNQSKPSAGAPPVTAVQSQTVIADVTGNDVRPVSDDVTMSSSVPVLSATAPRGCIAQDSQESVEMDQNGVDDSSLGGVSSGSSADVFLTEGGSLGSVDSSESAGHPSEDAEERIVYLGERQAVAFSLDDVIGSPPQLPDDFYDVTEEDVRRRLRQLRQQVAELGEGGALMTSEQREARRQADLLTRLAAHRHCVIRAQFPDRLVLQAVFLSTDTVATVTEFLSTHLQQPSAALTLYTTPPRTALPPQSRLYEVDCVPAALVHVASVGGATVALSSAVRSRLSSPAGASLALKKTRPSPTISGSESSTSGCSSSEDVAEARARASRAAAARSSQRPARPDAPKWFKMGTK